MVQLNHLFSIIQFKDDSRFKGEFVYLSELLFLRGILQYLHNILIPLCHYKAVFNTFTIIIVSGVYCLSLSKRSCSVIEIEEYPIFYSKELITQLGNDWWEKK